MSCGVAGHDSYRHRWDAHRHQPIQSLLVIEMPRFRVFGEKESRVEAVVDAVDSTEAEELVFTAWADGSRPQGLVEFWESDDEPSLSSEPIEWSEEEE